MADYKALFLNNGVPLEKKPKLEYLFIYYLFVLFNGV